MKKTFKSILLGGAFLLALPVLLTSCDPYLDDIFGHWERPAPVNPNPTPDPMMKETPLTLEAKTAGAVVTFIADDDAFEKTVEYSTDGGTTWTSGSTNKTAGGISVTLDNAGDKVMFRGTNDAYGNAIYYNSITCDKDCYVYGNIMSLINKDNFATNTELTADGAFYNLFKGNGALYFHDTKTLELPATALTNGCYQQMFMDCIKITKAPTLSATTLKDHCYEGMFQGCTALTTIQEELPATSLVSYCYFSMFEGCTALEKAPKLPATVLASYCYQSMFRNCTKLNEVWVKAAYADGSMQCAYMFNGCTDASTSIFHGADAANYKTNFTGLASWTADTTY